MPFLKCLYGRTLNLSTTSILYFYGKNVYPFIPEYKTTCFMFYKTPTQQTLTYSTMLAITETVSHLQPPSSDDPRVIHGACPRSHLSKGLVAPLVSRWRGREKKKAPLSRGFQWASTDSSRRKRNFRGCFWHHFMVELQLEPTNHRSRWCCTMLISDSFLSSHITTSTTTTNLRQKLTNRGGCSVVGNAE